MSTWRGQTDAKTINYDDDDDDWDTEADFVNDVSEKEQRWGSKAIEGSLSADKDVSVREVREGVVSTHEKKVKEEYQKGPMGSAGYGGKFGVQNDRMDKSAGSWAHNEEVSKHSSVTDSSKGFGGKFGVQKDRQDKTSVGYDHQTELSKHNSQTDGAKGFGGKFGVQQGSQDKNAVGYDHQTELSKHNSQTDGAKGFGGKFGVDKTKQDKSAQGYSDGGGPVSGTGYKTAIDVKGDVKNFRSRFENFGAGQEEETRKKLEAEREKRRQDDEKRKADEKKREEERDRQFASENKEKADKQAELKRREEAIAEEKRVKEENSVAERKRAEEETRLKGVEEEKKRVRNLKEQAEQQNRQDDERQKQEGERKRQEQEDARRKQEEEDDRKRGEEEKVRRKESEREAEKRQKEEDARVEQERQRAEDQRRAEDQKREEERLAEAERMRQEEELAKQTAALSVSASGKTATAVFDYTAGPDGDEVSFSQGDIISNVEQPDEGWWVGEVGGKKGMFPASYVTLNEDVVAAEPVEPVKPKRQSSNLGSSDEGLCGVALYSYTAADTDELTFDEGEKITNVEKPDEGWWLGVCRGRKGIFPASYITISGSASALPNLGQCGKAIYSYDAADVDELTLVEGVRVTNIEMIDEGWWMGQCNGGKGIFPASYVQLED